MHRIKDMNVVLKWIFLILVAPLAVYLAIRSREVAFTES